MSESGTPQRARLDDLLELGLGSAFATMPEDGDDEITHLMDTGIGEVVPAQVGRYRILSILGRGGLGLVLQGHDAELGRDVAIKILKRPWDRDVEIRRLFREEARTCSQLQHPGVVSVHEIGQIESGAPYYTMRMVSGQTL